MTLYQYKESAAIQSEQGGRITEPGAYIGQITMAKKVISKEKQTQGIEFTFEDDSGATASYLTLYTFNKEGKELFGFNQVCAIMKLLGVNEFSSKMAQVEEYDVNTRSMQNFNREVYFSLIGKPIGFVLGSETYINSNGEQKQKMVFKTAFCPNTKRTASEIINNQPATKVVKMVASLVSKKANSAQQSAHQQAKQNGYQPQGNNPANPSSLDLDDDIPF